jgi:acyl carrier protein
LCSIHGNQVGWQNRSADSCHGALGRWIQLTHQPKRASVLFRQSFRSVASAGGKSCSPNLCNTPVRQMTISSRTPEGESAACLLCQEIVVVEPSILIGDATCPCCGQLLWFIQWGDRRQIFDSRRSSETRDRVIQIMSERLGLTAQRFVNVPRLQLDQRLNSLDLVELIMEIEDATT